jgi:pyrroline-5-carboxylate reductase
MQLEGQKIGFFGGGAMGEALIAGLLRKGLVEASEVYVCDIVPERLSQLENIYKVNTIEEPAVLVDTADVLLLAVKPFSILPLLEEVGARARESQVFISIAAGITLAQLESGFVGPIPVIRAMPNTPCLVGEGATALSPGKYTGTEHLQKAMAIFAASGEAVVLPEAHFDAVTGLSGSGPAYLYILLEGFIDGAVRLGVPRDAARLLITQTMLGAAKMVLETGEHPGKLKDMVTTPGGTTMAGLYALEDGGARALMMKAVAAAARRSEEMAEIK